MLPPPKTAWPSPISSRPSRSDTLAAVARERGSPSCTEPAESRISAVTSREPVGVERRRRASPPPSPWPWPEPGEIGREVERAEGERAGRRRASAQSRDLQRPGGIVSVERELARSPPKARWPLNTAAPERSPARASSRGRSGCRARRRSRGATASTMSSAPASCGDRIVVDACAGENHRDRRGFDARLERRRAAVQEVERRRRRRRRTVTCSPRQMPEPATGERLAHARPVDAKVDGIEPLDLAVTGGSRR